MPAPMTVTRNAMALLVTTHMTSSAAPLLPDCNTFVVGKKRVRYVSNRSITDSNLAITRAIIVIHGGYRVPEEYYAPILVAMEANRDLQRHWRPKTLVLAPHFQ